MTAPTHRLPHSHPVAPELLRRLHRALTVLLLLAAAGAGVLLAVFVTPYLVPVLGVLALLVLIGVIVHQTVQLLGVDEDLPEDPA